MSWEARYIAPDPNPWRGREDIPHGTCFFHHVELVDLLNTPLTPPSKPAFAFVGFKCDEGAQRDLGRTGAVEGPMAIRQRLAKLPFRATDLSLFDVGSIICNDHDLRSSQQALADIVSLLLENNIHPIVLGGGHEVALGHFNGLNKHYGKDTNLGIVSFDAHFNLAPLKPSNRPSTSTTFHEIAKACEQAHRHFDYNCIGIQHASNTRVTFEVARHLDTKVLLADDLHLQNKERCYDFIDRVIDENEIIYVSLSMDVFSPAHAPGVSTIQPLGLTPWHVIPMLRQLAESGRVVSYDISEHVPRYDIDHRTARLAATLIYEIIHAHQFHHVMP